MQEQTSKAQRGHGRVAFLPLLEDIRKLLKDGYPLIFIYNRHQQQLGIGYTQFTKYIHRYLKTDNFSENKKETAAAKEKQSAVNKPVVKSTVFTHDPNSGNTRKDLI